MITDKCPRMDIFQHWISKDDSCQTMLSVDTEDTGHYSEGWQPLAPGSGSSPNGYRFYTADELEGLPYTGMYATFTYSGGLLIL